MMYGSAIMLIACFAALFSKRAMIWGVAGYLVIIHYVEIWLDGSMHGEYITPFAAMSIAVDALLIKWLSFIQVRKKFIFWGMMGVIASDIIYSLLCIFEPGTIWYDNHLLAMRIIVTLMLALGVYDGYRGGYNLDFIKGAFQRSRDKLQDLRVILRGGSMRHLGANRGEEPRQ